MEALVRSVNRIAREDVGQDMIEYALLIGFLSVGIITALTVAGTEISIIWTAVTTMLNNAAAAL